MQESISIVKSQESTARAESERSQLISGHIVLRRRLLYMCQDFISQATKLRTDGDRTLRLARLLANALENSSNSEERAKTAKELEEDEEQARAMYACCPRGICD